MSGGEIEIRKTTKENADPELYEHSSRRERSTLLHGLRIERLVKIEYYRYLIESERWMVARNVIDLKVETEES